VAEEFEVRFGDDFTDRITEIVGECDLSDAVSEAVTNLFSMEDPEDYFDMDNYAKSDDVSDIESDVSRHEDEINGLNKVLSLFANLLADNGFVAEGYEKKVGQV